MDIDWESMTPEEAEALAAGMQAAEENQKKALQARCDFLETRITDAFYALGYGEVKKARKILLGAVNPKEAVEEVCSYCGGEGGEPGREPCPVCLDGRK